MTGVHYSKSIKDIIGDIGEAIGDAAKDIAKKWRKLTDGEPQPEPIPIPIDRDRRHEQRDEFRELSFNHPR